MVYIVEYAKSDRSTCKGPKKDCISSTHHISKGELRLGVETNVGGHNLLVWRHWLCTTPKVLENMKEAMSSPEEIEGFNTIRDEDREQIQTAWDEGQLPDKEDIPETSDVKEKASSDKADKKKEKTDKQSTTKTKKEAETSAKTKKNATPKAEPTRRSTRVKEAASVEKEATPSLAKKRAATKSKTTTASASTKRAKKN